MFCIIHNNSDLEYAALMYVPMEMSKHGCNMVKLPGFTNKSSSTVLYSLQLLYIDLWKMYQEAVTHVKSRGDKSMDQPLCARMVKKASQFSKSVNLEAGRFTYVVNMLTHVQVLVKSNS